MEKHEYCSECGHKLNANQSFCSQCGMKLIPDAAVKNVAPTSNSSSELSEQDKKKIYKILAGVGAILLVLYMLNLTKSSGEYLSAETYTENKRIGAVNGRGYYLDVTTLKIVSKTELITISSIELNHGACQISEYDKKKFPQSLRLGEIIEVGIPSSDCELLELQIVTDKGEQQFSFSKQN